MKTRLLLLGITITFMSACAFTNKTVPGAGIPFARADYKLKGATSDKECRTYIVGLNFPRLFFDEFATISGGGGGGIMALIGNLFGGGYPETAEALYKAIAKMPGATHLLKSTVKSTFSGFGWLGMPFFGKRCSAVRAHAVHMGQPFPQNGPSKGGIGQDQSEKDFEDDGITGPKTKMQKAAEDADKDVQEADEQAKEDMAAEEGEEEEEEEEE